MPRMRNSSTSPNVCSVGVRHIKRQTNCFDCELRKVRQNLASISLLVQPAREFRRIPLPYGSELLGCPKTLPARHLQILEKSSAECAAPNCPKSDVFQCMGATRPPLKEAWLQRA